MSVAAAKRPAPEEGRGLFDRELEDLEPVDVARTRVKGTVGFQLTSQQGQHARYEHRYVDFDYGVRTPIKVSPVAHVKFGYLPICDVHHQTLELTSNLPGERLDLGPVMVTDDCVAATVVEPVAPCTIATARSARESFRTPVARARCASASGSSPTRRTPSITAIVAGTAPAALTISSTS